MKDVNFAVDLSGWQGRVLEILDDGNIDVAWDSQTLLHDMPASMIAACEEEGYGWETCVFEPDELEVIVCGLPIAKQ